MWRFANMNNVAKVAIAATAAMVAVVGIRSALAVVVALSDGATWFFAHRCERLRRILTAQGRR